jgi:DNA-binding NarL/FixJ family response regulator
MPDCDPEITVVIASDSPLFGQGLSALFDDVPTDHAPDALIISVRSLAITTEAIVTAVRAMRHLYPNMGIVVISDRVHQFALDLLRGSQSGAAFLADESLLSVESVVDAVKETLVGQNALDESVLDSFIRSGDTRHMDQLTQGQVAILELMARGLSNRAIADELHYSVKSIEKGITAIFLKLGPFEQGLSDRRVSAALVYLRAQTDPNRAEHEEVPAATPVVLIDDPEGGSPT